MNRIHKILLTIAASLCLFVPGASAATIDFNLDGLSVLKFTNAQGDGFRLVTEFSDVAAWVEIDTSVNPISPKLSFDYDNAKGAIYELGTGKKIGSAVQDLSFLYNDLALIEDPVTGSPVDLIGRDNSSGTGILNLDQIVVDGASPVNPSRRLGLEQKFASITDGSSEDHKEKYKPLVNSGGFSIVAGSDYEWQIRNIATNFHLWLGGTRNIGLFGETYSVTGDIHANFSRSGEPSTEVPEPTSLLLLGAGLAGLVSKKKSHS